VFLGQFHQFARFEGHRPNSVLADWRRDVLSGDVLSGDVL